MLKIGITQRVDYIASIGETRDVLDQRWCQLFRQNELIGIPIPNQCNVLCFIKNVDLDGILISGGNDHSTRTTCETACIDYCIKHHLPLLGICHGMQFIGEYFGAKLIPISGHVGNGHVVHVKDNRYGIPIGNFEVNSFHNFTLDKIPNVFSCFATDEVGYCEGMQHQFLPIVTFMWHPERPPFLNWFNHFIKDFYGKH